MNKPDVTWTTTHVNFETWLYHKVAEDEDEGDRGAS
jgi:hypothetical protein